MTPHSRPSRRTFLTQIGRTAAGLIVVGPLAAACSDGEAEPELADTAPDIADQAAEPQGTATAAPSEATAGGDAPPGPADIRQVSLGFVSAFVLVRAGEAMVIDTGTEGSASAIEMVLGEAGVGWSDVSHVVVTHTHGDHDGSLSAVADLAPDAALYGGEADIGSMSAARPILGVNDGDRIFGTRVIATPGHTAGHISIFDPETGALFAGDAVTNIDGTLGGSPPDFTADADMAAASVRVLADLAPTALYVGHGEVLTTDVAGSLSDLAASL